MWLEICWKNTEGPPSQAVTFALENGKIVVGRGDACDIVLAARQLSRKHFSLTIDNDEASFQDLGSRSGVLRNGVKQLHGNFAVGDVLEAGELQFRLLTRPSTFVEPAREKTRTSSINWSSFLEITQNLRHAATPREVLERLLKGLVDLLSADRGFVLLQQQGALQFVPVVRYAVDDMDDLACVCSTVCRKAVSEGKLLFIADPRGDDRLIGAKSLYEGGIRSIVAAPLLSDGPMLGVLYLDVLAVEKGIRVEHLEMVEAVAGFAGILLAAKQTRSSLLKAHRRLRVIEEGRSGFDTFVLGEGEFAKQLDRSLSAASRQDVTVLITGDTGTGKELVARELHRRSDRSSGPFVAVNCAALPDELVESELFGVMRGAYTGAQDTRIGRFRAAEGGTLFLDEVGELPPEIQVKLLRVLQERVVVPLGGQKGYNVDFRLVCATNIDLEQAINDGTMRQDFYFRINVFRIHLVPLAERREMIIPLARHILANFARDMGRAGPVGFSPGAMTALEQYDWPGNIRELRNIVERALVLARGEIIDIQHLPFGSTPPTAQTSTGSFSQAPLDFIGARDVFERWFLQRSLKANKGNVSAVARETGLTRATIYRWLKRFENMS